MPLILRAISLNQEPLLSAPSATFDVRGGSIGRAESNTLALPDPDRHLSRLQAEVHWRDGRHELRNVGGPAPVVVDGRAVPQGGSVRLAAGCELRIGGYRLRAELDRDGPAAVPSAALDSPHQPAALAGWPGPAEVGPGQSGFTALLGPPSDAAGGLDDLPADWGAGPLAAARASTGTDAVRSGAADSAESASQPRPAAVPVAAPPAAQRATASRPGAAAEADPFGLPPPAGLPASAGIVRPAPAPAAAPLGNPFDGPSGATDPWAEFDAPSGAAVRSQPSGWTGFDDVAGSSSDGVFDDLLGSTPGGRQDVARSIEEFIHGAAPPPPPPPGIEHQRLQPWEEAADLGGGSAPPARPSPRSARPPAVASGPPRQGAAVPLPPVSAAAPRITPVSPVSPVSQPDTPRAGDAAWWQAVWEGAGLDPQRLPPPDADAARDLGRSLRAAVDGLHALIRLRQNEKQAFRAGLTQIQARQNNPLKFSVDGQAATEQLLRQPARGFLPAPEALREAGDDLLAHAIGQVAGMRAALQGVLGRFDPADLEKRLARRQVLDLLPASRRSRLWELYVEHAAALRREADDDFHALFGRAFLDAYEEQIARLDAERPR